jgi:hypothetical protein
MIMISIVVVCDGVQETEDDTGVVRASEVVAAVMVSVLKSVVSLTLCYYDKRGPKDLLTSPTG